MIILYFIHPKFLIIRMRAFVVFLSRYFLSLSLSFPPTISFSFYLYFCLCTYLSTIPSLSLPLPFPYLPLPLSFSISPRFYSLSICMYFSLSLPLSHFYSLFLFHAIPVYLSINLRQSACFFSLSFLPLFPFSVSSLFFFS